MVNPEDINLPPAAVGVMPPVTARTNLATVTYPVVLAKTPQRVGKLGNPAFEFPCANAIDQFAILLTRKDTPQKAGMKHIPVFCRLNYIKYDGDPIKKKTHHDMMKQFKFAGIAYTGAADGNGDGTPSMFASVIGGSHTVMTKHCEHDGHRFTPGDTVRWTLPKNLTGERPVTYHGDSGTGVFVELEPVNYDDDLKYLTDAGYGGEVHKEMAELRQREIGVIINDNGRGSVDIRLK